MYVIVALAALALVWWLHAHLNESDPYVGTPEPVLPPRAFSPDDRVFARSLVAEHVAERAKALTPPVNVVTQTVHADAPTRVPLNAQEVRMNALRKRVRKALNYRIAEFMRAHNVPMSAWDTITRSTIVVTEDGGMYVGVWDTRDEAVTAIMGLDAEAREEMLLTMDVAFPRTQAELDGYKAHTRALLDALDEQVDERESMLAALARLAPAFKVQPVITTNAPMTATERLRAERKAAGLTARGTTPQPRCEATTHAGERCKRLTTAGSRHCAGHFSPVSTW